MKIGIVGAGYWGPNLVRNFSRVEKINRIVLCDINVGRLNQVKKTYPEIEITDNYDDLINNPEIIAIAIATKPISTHYTLAKKAIENGKHVFMEKPMTASSKEAEELISLAKKNKVFIHVDHTFEYSSPVLYIKQLIDSGVLGKIHTINFERENLGIFQNDFNVIWDLCPHDFSMLNLWLGEKPKEVFASGTCHVHPKIEDDAHVILRYDGELGVHMHVSWLYPQKIRRVTVIGSKKMVVFDDVEPVEKIKVYDKGVSAETFSAIKQKYYSTFEEYKYYYRHGDIVVPKIDNVEPLATECAYFIDCIEKNVPSKTDGQSGLNVVRLIELTEKSLKEKRVVSDANT